MNKKGQVEKYWKLIVGGIIFILLIVWVSQQQDFVCGNAFLDFFCKK